VEAPSFAPHGNLAFFLGIIVVAPFGKCGAEMNRTNFTDIPKFSLT
jgi:hypothetical protein